MSCCGDNVPLSVQTRGSLLNVIVMADYLLDDQPEAVVIGVDADGTSYVLEENGAFSTANGSFSVVEVSPHTLITFQHYFSRHDLFMHN